MVPSGWLDEANQARVPSKRSTSASTPMSGSYRTLTSNAPGTCGLPACGIPRVNLKGVRDLVNRVSKLAGFEGLVEPDLYP